MPIALPGVVVGVAAVADDGVAIATFGVYLLPRVVFAAAAMVEVVAVVNAAFVTDAILVNGVIRLPVGVLVSMFSVVKGVFVAVPLPGGVFEAEDSIVGGVALVVGPMLAIIDAIIIDDIGFVIGLASGVVVVVVASVEVVVEVSITGISFVLLVVVVVFVVEKVEAVGDAAEGAIISAGVVVIDVDWIEIVLVMQDFEMMS